MHAIDRKDFNSDEDFKNALWKMYNDDAGEYIRQSNLYGGDEFNFDKNTLYPMIFDVVHDAVQLSVGFDYIIQDIVDMIHRAGVNHVYDIGSRFEGFITHLLAMDVRVTMLDIRPLVLSLEGFDFIQTDVMQGMNEIEDNSLETVSSLHAFEHFGLGRYGDPVDYDGWKKAIDAVKKKLAVGGRFYLGVPLAKKNMLCFNAHRYFHPATIISAVVPDLTLESFSYVHSNLIKYKKYIAEQDSLENLNQIFDITEKFVERDNVGLFVFRKTHLI